MKFGPLSPITRAWMDWRSGPDWALETPPSVNVARDEDLTAWAAAAWEVERFTLREATKADEQPRPPRGIDFSKLNDAIAQLRPPRRKP